MKKADITINISYFNSNIDQTFSILTRDFLKHNVELVKEVSFTYQNEKEFKETIENEIILVKKDLDRRANIALKTLKKRGFKYGVFLTIMPKDSKENKEETFDLISKYFPSKELWPYKEEKEADRKLSIKF